MKNRLKAILLATGLTASMMFTCAYADDASTEAATEAVTEAATEAATEEATEAAATEAAAAADEASTEAAEESSEAVSEAAAEESSEVASEAAAVEDAAQEAAATGKYAAYYENLEQGVVQTFPPLPGGLNVDGQIPLGLLLAGVVGEQFGPQADLRRILGHKGGGDDGRFQPFGKFQTHFVLLTS